MPNRPKENKYISKNFQRLDIGTVKVKVDIDKPDEVTVEVPVPLEEEIPLELPAPNVIEQEVSVYKKVEGHSENSLF